MTHNSSLNVSFNALKLSISQILFKLVTAKLKIIEHGLLRTTFFNTHFVDAMLFYVMAAHIWLLPIKEIPLSITHPPAVLAFLMTPALEHFSLMNHHPSIRWFERPSSLSALTYHAPSKL